MEDNQRIDFVDVLRGIGILFMILGHIGFGEKANIYLHAFHMPLFFFVSGWFYHTLPADTSMFIKKKAQSLLIPYYFFAIFHFGLIFVLEDEINIAAVKKHLYHILFYPTVGIPVAGALWFLMALFWTNVIFHFIHKNLYQKDNILLAVSLIIGMLGMIITSLRGIRLPWALDAAMVGVSFFGTAYFLKQKQEYRCVAYCFSLNWKKLIVLFTVNACMIFYNGMINMRKGLYANFILTYANAIILIILLWNLSRLLNSYRLSNVIKEIGRNSLVFVCINQIVIKIIKWRIIKCFGELSRFSWFISRLVTLTVVCFICYVVMILIENSKLKVILGKQNTTVH